MNGLKLAFDSAINGLDIYQKHTYISARNIERASEEGYSRLELNLTTDSMGQAQIQQIDKITDEYMEKIRAETYSESAYHATNSYFTNRVQELLGSPGNFDKLKSESIPRNLSDAIDSFFSKLNILANSPENNIFKASLIQTTQNLSNMMSDISQEVQLLQWKSDQELESSVRMINHQLSIIYNCNSSIKNHLHRDEAKANLEMQREQAILKLSENLDCNIMKQSDDRIFINAFGGRTILDDNQYFLNHSTLSNPNQKDYLPILISCQDKRIDTTEANTSKLKECKVKALLETRDQYLNSILSQLDTLAYNVSNEVNKVYSSGVSSPGISTMSSATKINLEQDMGFEGEIAIIVLDKAGRPAIDVNGDQLIPLTIKLDSINTQELINQINQYYTLTLNRVETDDIYDIQIGNLEENDNKLSLDLIVNNKGLDERSLTLHNARVEYIDSTNGNAKVTTNQSIDLKQYINALPGKNTHSTKTVELDLTNLPNNINEFIIALDLEINGQISTISYKIPSLDIYRYSAYKVEGSENVKLVSNLSTKQYVKASLINDSQEEIFLNNREGYLKIETPNKNNVIAIHNLNSKHKNGNNFSHQLEINTLFNQEKKTQGSAYNFKINQNILDDPSKFNSGKLIKKENTHTYETGIGDGSGALELSKLEFQIFAFDNNDNLPFSQTTLSDYAAKITEYNALRSTQCSLQSDHYQERKEHYDQKHESVSGVNIDEEIAKTVLISNMHAASAKTLNSINEITDELLKII